MSYKAVKVNFLTDNDYTDDFGNTYEKLNSVLRVPSDLTEAKITAILTAAKMELRTTSKSVCGVGTSFNKRFLKFTRSNGNSISIPIYARDQLKTVGNAIIQALNTNDFKVVCVELIGEFWLDVRDLLRTTPPSGQQDQLPPIEPNTDLGKHKLIYSGTMTEYKRDSGNTYGETDLIPFNMQTNLEGEPYTGLTTQINGCLGTVNTSGLSCGSKGKIVTPRRFVPSILTRPYNNGSPPTPDENATDSLQTLTIASSKHLAADIKACGTALANITAIQCLAYYGESNKKYHQILTLA
jgi:hypothetical protein